MLEPVTIYILSNISQSKGKQSIKFGQLIEYNKIFFLKSHAENKAGRLIRDLVLLFKKSFICGKSKWPAASFQYILIGLNMAYNKNKLYETFGN